jgi:ATP-binding cassette, subfamily B, bacterial PglK
LKNYINKIIFILPKYWIKNIFYIISLTLLSAISELFGIGLIIPFLSLFLDKGNFIFEYFPAFKDLGEETLILYFIFLFLIIFFFKNIFLIIIQKIKINFSYDLAKEISAKLYLRYLKKKYIFFTLKNTSELIRNTTAEGHLFSFGVILPILTLISELIIFLAIIIFLLFYNPIATLTISIVMILFGSLVIIFQLKKIKMFGLIRQTNANFLLKLVTESIGNIKEIILSSNQKFFTSKFLHHTNELAKAGKKRDFFHILTRPILEVLTVLMFFILVYMLTKFGSTYSEIFVILGVFTFAAFKLVSVIGNLMKGIQDLRYNSVVVNVIYKELLNDDNKFNYKNNFPKTKNFLKFKKIDLINVNYSYPANDLKIFEKINFEINSGDKVGLVGKSGSGKTTLINLLTGLIEPSGGLIKLNEQNLQNNIEDWQNMIGYVSQNVYLADESILFNITLNKAGEKVNLDRVNKLVEILDLKNLIQSKKDGLNTSVGEKGIKISGGQIQRIGIARAMYDQPEILILDEATNALDSLTQDKVLRNISKEMQNRTVISISHDKNSLRYCNKIYSVNKNEIKKID